jgi:chemotaxis signal transduction protein
MNNLSISKSRRFGNSQTEATRQLVVFRLRHEWFALLLEVVQKVLQMGNAFGDVRGTGVGLTLYQDRELVVVDIGHRLFGEALYALPPVTEAEAVASSMPTYLSGNSGSVQQQQASNQERCMLIVQTSQGELVGLPIDSLPVLRRVPDSAFSPLPPAYISQVNIQCVSSAVIQSPDEPPLFLINPDQLLQPWNNPSK